MSECKKQPVHTRGIIKPNEKIYRNMLFMELETRIDKYPISNRSKLFVVGMVKHKIMEGMEK